MLPTVGAEAEESPLKITQRYFAQMHYTKESKSCTELIKDWLLIMYGQKLKYSNVS